MGNNDVRAIIEEALLPSEDTAEEAEVTDEEAVVTPDAQGEESTEEDTSEASEDESEAQEGTDENTPTEYFGVNLEGLSAEDRATLIAGFQERDKFIQQLLRNKAEEPEESGPAKDASGDDAEDATDADILQALGLDDPDNPYAEYAAKVALPLSKLVLSLQSEVAEVKQRAEVDATGRYWDDSLTALEAQFGKLPVSHDDVLRQAAEAGVAEPVDAYWRIMGPARQQVMAEVQKRREAFETAQKKGAKGALRPAAQAETTEAIIDAKDGADAMRQAVTALFKERGITVVED